jgi:hypothetical protein
MENPGNVILSAIRMSAPQFVFPLVPEAREAETQAKVSLPLSRQPDLQPLARPRQIVKPIRLS